MTAVWLIAVNFVREQRWFILLMLVYIAGITALMVVAGEGRDNDTLIVLKQEAFYGVFFSVVIAAAVFQNERKTRRILSVLSKAITRRDYVAGIVLGVNLTLLIFYAAVFASLFVLFPHAPVADAARMMLAVMVLSVLASVVTVFFATFLHPLVATTAAGAVLTLPLLVENMLPALGAALPTATLVHAATGYSPDVPFALHTAPLLLALGEAVVLWLVASWIFSLRDITATVE